MFSRSFGLLESGKDIGGSIANSRALTLYVTLAGFFPDFHFRTMGNPVMSEWKLMPSQHIFDTTLRAISNRLKNSEGRKDVLSLWLKQRDENPEKFSERELYGCVNMTVGAGAATVSATMQSIFYHLIRHPHYLARLRDEISDAGLNDDVISYADASRLQFLGACIKRSMAYIPTCALRAGSRGTERWDYDRRSVFPGEY